LYEATKTEKEMRKEAKKSDSNGENGKGLFQVIQKFEKEYKK